MSGTFVEVTGIDQIKQILRDVTPRHANNLMRNTIRGVAAEIRKDIRSTAPKGDQGRLAAARNIKVKMRRAKQGAQVAEVVFNNKTFFWRFVEHGTGGDNPQPARPFVIPARNRAASRLDRMIAQSFSRTLEKTIKRQLKKQAKVRK